MSFLSLHKVTKPFRQNFPIIISSSSSASSFWKPKVSTDIQTHLDVDQNQTVILHVSEFLVT